MNRASLIFGCILAYCVAWADDYFESQWDMQMDLTGQTGWTHYVDYGGWMLFNLGTNYPGTLTLSQTAMTGVYHAWVKALRFFTNGYNTNDPIRVEVGGTFKDLNPDDMNYNGRWTGPFLLNTSSNASQLKVYFLQAEPSCLQKIVLYGFALTSNTNYLVTDHDEFVYMDPNAYPTNPGAPVRKGNLVQDASFECSLGHGWSIDSSTRDYTVASRWTNVAAHSGNHSANILCSQANGFLSHVYRVNPNQTHTFSLWARAAQENVAPPQLRLIVENTYTPPTGFQSRCMLSNAWNVPLDSTWHRYSVSGTLYQYPAENYQLRVVAASGMGIYIDDLQFEEGTLTDYSPQSWNLGLTLNEASGVYYTNDQVTIKVVARNDSGASNTVSAALTVYDWANGLAFTSNAVLSVQNGQQVTNSIDLPTLKYGHYRAICHLTNLPSTREEITFCILGAISTNGYSMGAVHPGATSDGIQFAKRAGIRWSRTLSPAQTFRWSIIEPTQGNYDWSKPDADVPRFYTNGMSIFGVLGEESNPSWAEALETTDTNAWTTAYKTFASNVVYRYYNSVAAWEIMNEPDSNIQGMSAHPEWYARCLKETYDVIHGIDTNAQVVGIASDSYAYASNVTVQLANLYPTWDWTNDLAGIACHIYPGVEGTTAANYGDYFVKQKGVEVWNTETGSWSDGFHTTANSNFRLEGRLILPCRSSARFYNTTDDIRSILDNLLTCIGYGFTRYFYYDSRLYHSQMDGTSPTIRDYDDSIKPTGVALCQAYGVLDGATGKGKVTLVDASINAFLFEKQDTTAIAAIWREDTPFKILAMTNSPGVIDLMGNSLGSFSNVTAEANPKYLTYATVSGLSNLLTSATISTNLDTNAPNLFIADWSTANGSRDGVWIRFFALDGRDLPADARPTVLNYSWQLNGVDPAWTPWTPDTFASYGFLPTASYTFSVKARDNTSNTTDTVTLTFSYDDGSLKKKLKMRGRSAGRGKFIIQ